MKKRSEHHKQMPNSMMKFEKRKDIKYNTNAI